jgi:cytoskeleton protein RodZ
MTLNAPTPSGLPSDTASENGSRGQRIGMLLRRTREGRRIAIADVAATLRIRVTYLEAIEKGAYERLPGATYAVGFVRAYAEYLGLDGEEAARRFKREGQGLDGQHDLSPPAPIAERSIPGGRILLVALVLAICGYGFWYYLSGDRQRPDTVAAVPPALTTEASTPSEAKAAVREPGGPSADAPNPAQPAPLTVATAAAPTLPPDNPEPGHVFGVADGPVRIVLRFTGDCWIQIKGGGPDADFGKLMHAGDVYRVPDHPSLVLRVGDSQHVTITLDGRIVTLPPANSLVRNVALDPAQLTAWAGAPVAAPAATAPTPVALTPTSTQAPVAAPAPVAPAATTPAVTPAAAKIDAPVPTPDPDAAAVEPKAN